MLCNPEARAATHPVLAKHPAAWGPHFSSSLSHLVLLKVLSGRGYNLPIFTVFHLKNLRFPEVTTQGHTTSVCPQYAALLTIQIPKILTWKSLLLPKGNTGSFQLIKFSLDIRWRNIPLERKRCQKVSGSLKVNHFSPVY